MSSLSRPLTLLGLLLLSHACYSAYEHYSLTTASASNPHLSTQPPPTANNNLPADISLETLTSVILICVGLVLGSEELKPISWRVWAGKVEREHGAGGPFGGLEERWGFMDVRAKRREFADWVRGQEEVGKGQ